MQPGWASDQGDWCLDVKTAPKRLDLIRVLRDQRQVAVAAGKVSVSRHEANRIGRRGAPIDADALGAPSRDRPSRSNCNPCASQPAQPAKNRVVRAAESRRDGDDGLPFVDVEPLQQSRVDR